MTSTYSTQGVKHCELLHTGAVISYSTFDDEPVEFEWVPDLQAHAAFHANLEFPDSTRPRDLFKGHPDWQDLIA
jgi:hypothetical protein